MRRDELKVRYFILPTVIVAFMIMAGIWIHNKMEDSRLANNTMYETAIPADDKDSYDYILETQQGIFYTHGLFTAEQPVEFSEIDGKYAELKRREEHYVMKTRVVTYTDSEGNTHTKTETYWEWEHYHTDYLSTKTIMFNDHSYDYDKFSGFPESHITTRHPRSDVRVKYYGVPVKMELTFLANASEKGLSPAFGRKIYVESTAYDKFVESNISDGKVGTIFIVIIWVVLTGVALYGYGYLEANEFN